MFLTSCATAASSTIKSYEEQLESGYIFMEAGKYEEAIIAFNKAIEIDPKQAKAYIGLAEAYVERGDDFAEMDAREALQLGYEESQSNEITNAFIMLAEKIEELFGKESSLRFMQFGYKVTNDDKIFDIISKTEEPKEETPEEPKEEAVEKNKEENKGIDLLDLYLNDVDNAIKILGDDYSVEEDMDMGEKYIVYDDISLAFSDSNIIYTIYVIKDEQTDLSKYSILGADCGMNNEEIYTLCGEPYYGDRNSFLYKTEYEYNWIKFDFNQDGNLEFIRLFAAPDNTLGAGFKW
jgi:tetratricopeptide (TPR) repeat protein